MFLSFIKLYQYLISPLFLPRCRFIPSCSEYASEAVKKLGVVKGGILAIYRFLRCNAFCKGGLDEVPKQFNVLRIFVKNKHHRRK